MNSVLIAVDPNAEVKPTHAEWLVRLTPLSAEHGSMLVKLVKQVNPLLLVTKTEAHPWNTSIEREA